MRSAALLAVLLMVLGVSIRAQVNKLAPTGTLRAAFLQTNPVQARVDSRTGEVTGLVADLVAELARRQGVKFRLIPAPDARAVINHVSGGTADVGFLAYEEARAKEVDFAGGFAVMFNTYLVGSSSPLKSVGDADRAGLTIGAVKGQTQQIYLSANLKQARVQILDTMPNQHELERLLAAKELDAFGLNQQRAIEGAKASQGKLRALSGSFLGVEQAFVVRKGARESAALLNGFVDELRMSGFLKKSIDRAGLVGVGVANNEVGKR